MWIFFTKISVSHCLVFMWFEKTAFDINKAAQYFWEAKQAKAEERLSLDGVG